MTKHTLEPWKPDNNRRHIIGNGRDIARVFGAFEDNEADANVSRIVACVNACQGLNPEAIPDLLAACKTIRDGACPNPEHPAFGFGGPVPTYWFTENHLAEVKAAIAKAEQEES